MSSKEKEKSSLAVPVRNRESIAVENNSRNLTINSSNTSEILTETCDNNNEISENSVIIIKNMLINYGKEFLCLFLLILTCASFQNIPPKISRAPIPRAFFSKTSVVHDSPTGSLAAAQLRVSLSELALMFYYAPWCAESQYARQSYDAVANLFHREVHFGAINCWQPGGECRIQYAKVQSWPVLMAYLPSGLAIQYHGTWTNSSLVRFVKSLLSPIKRFTSPESLLQEAVSCDGVVVSFVDMNMNKSHYWNFYQAAVRWLERDPYQEIKFGVVTGESSKLFGVDETPKIRMYLWNETLEYNGNTSWKHGEINKWVSDHIQQVTLWLAPPGTKSTSLSPYLKQGPILLFFTPRNLYTQSNDGYNMLRQIGMEYYNCRKDDWIHEMAHEYIPYQRKQYAENYQYLKTQCEQLYRIEKLEVPKSAEACFSHKSSSKYFSVTFANVLNTSKLPENQKDFCTIESDYNDETKYESHFTHERSAVTCDNLKVVRKRNTQDNDKPETSMLELEFDPRSPDSLNKLQLKKDCNLMRLSDLEFQSLFFTNEVKSLDSVSGLACEMNKTFSLIAMDSLVYHTFAERLGIDLLSLPSKSALLIIDPDNESTYLLRDHITIETAAEFLRDYRTHSLSRFLRSSRVEYEHTHFYTAESDITTQPAPTWVPKSKTVRTRDIRIEEIYSENFDDKVIQTDNTVITLFYSSQCALCGLMSQNLLSISNILKSLPNIKFYRIDGDKNDLPWFYTMNVFPSLIIFPGDDRKTESRMFPHEMRIDATNLLGFILANLNRPSRLYAMVLSCRKSKKIYFLNDCLNVLRNEITKNIEYSLREWRRSPHIRRHIVRRLQILQLLYLNLLKVNHSNDITILLENDAKYLYKIWTYNYNNNN